MEVGAGYENFEKADASVKASWNAEPASALLHQPRGERTHRSGRRNYRKIRDRSGNTTSGIFPDGPVHAGGTAAIL